MDLIKMKSFHIIVPLKNLYRILKIFQTTKTNSNEQYNVLMEIKIEDEVEIKPLIELVGTLLIFSLICLTRLPEETRRLIIKIL